MVLSAIVSALLGNNENRMLKDSKSNIKIDEILTNNKGNFLEKKKAFIATIGYKSFFSNNSLLYIQKSKLYH